MIQYFIKAVWISKTTKHTFVSYVLAEILKDGKRIRNAKISKQELINIVKKKIPVHTQIWNYSSGKWETYAEVSFEIYEKVEYLRTKKDETLIDNLHYLLPMADFSITPTV